MFHAGDKNSILRDESQRIEGILLAIASKEVVMSGVLPNREVENQYKYSFEKPTQSSDLKLHIEQLDQGLKIRIERKSGLIIPVKSELLRGLPKTSLVPKAFFDNGGV